MADEDIFAPQDNTGGAEDVIANPTNTGPNPETGPEAKNSAASEQPAESGDTLLGGADAAAPATAKAAPASEGEAKPEYTDFTLPEGAQIDEALMGDFKALAAECGLSQESAQKMIDLQAKVNASAMENAMRQRQAWRQEITKDVEFGQGNLQTTVQDARKLLDTYDDSGKVLAMLEQSGFGDNPDVIKFLAKVSRALPREDNVLTGREGVKADNRSLAERLWPGDV